MNRHQAKHQRQMASRPVRMTPEERLQASLGAAPHVKWQMMVTAIPGVRGVYSCHLAGQPPPQGVAVYPYESGDWWHCETHGAWRPWLPGQGVPSAVCPYPYGTGEGGAVTTLGTENWLEPYTVSKLERFLYRFRKPLHRVFGHSWEWSNRR